MSRADERNAWLFFSLLQAKAGTSVVSRLGDLSPVEAMELSPERFASRTGVSERVSSCFAETKRGFRPEEVLEKLSEKDISILTLADGEYPERLREMSDSPPALFVDGEVPDLPMVAVVGSRKASVGGVEVAERLGRELGERGVCVVSGLALGVDAAAHRGSLDAGGGTVGVLGCGIDVVYPRRNGELFAGVKRSGAVVSEYYLGEAPLAWHFPARNRIIAGLCETVVVVEAAEKSGALITARHALEAGRDVWAVPGPVGVPECRGSNRLLADGAGVIWDIAEFVESVSPEKREVHVPSDLDAPVPAELPPEEASALSGVGFEPEGVDVVAERCGMGMRELLSALTMLELKGYVGRDSSGSFLSKPVGR
ncbi:MAG: DNA-processing protein DprA [Rubrobacteraceae bacterium]